MRDSLNGFKRRKASPGGVQCFVHSGFRKTVITVLTRPGVDQLPAGLACPRPQRAELVHELRGGGGAVRAGLAREQDPAFRRARAFRARAGGPGALALSARR